jgi:ADP-ribose pyrophosphatase
MRFERTAREVVYEGRVVRLFKDRVRVEPGDGSAPRTLELEHIEHPGAACVVPFLDDGRILMLRQFRYSAGGELWELPAGKLDGHEPAEACARRELEEETGWVPRRLEHLSTLVMVPGYCDERIAIFAARDLVPGRANVGADELLRVIEMPLADALDRVRRGEITDAKTVAGLLLCGASAEPTGRGT